MIVQRSTVSANSNQPHKGTIGQLLAAERRMPNSDLPPVLVEGDTGTGKDCASEGDQHSDAALGGGGIVAGAR